MSWFTRATKDCQACICIFVNPGKVFRQGCGGVTGLPVSFSKCDISREQTAGLMCDISPRGESQVQIASPLDINGDSSSWPFPHSAIIPSCPLTKGSAVEAEAQRAAAGASACYSFLLTSLCFFCSSVSPGWLRGTMYNQIIPSALCFFGMHQQDQPLLITWLS